MWIYLAATLWAGRDLVRSVMSQPAGRSSRLESSAPLKGRWLRLFIASPSILLGAAFVLAVTWCTGSLWLAQFYFLVNASHS